MHANIMALLRGGDDNNDDDDDDADRISSQKC